MITNINNIFKINDKEPAYLSKTREICKSGEVCPLYIPRLMPGIEFSEPEVSNIFSKGTLCFKNAPQCRVLTATVIKTKNWLEIPFERNKTWEGQTFTDDKGTECISFGTKVTCNCPTYSLNDMTFSND